MEAVGRMDCPQWGAWIVAISAVQALTVHCASPRLLGGPARVEHDRLVVQVGEWDP
jgi:hypothetical protein